jgi:hypothetical protein
MTPEEIEARMVSAGITNDKLGGFFAREAARVAADLIAEARMDEQRAMEGAIEGAVAEAAAASQSVIDAARLTFSALFEELPTYTLVGDERVQACVTALAAALAALDSGVAPDEDEPNPHELAHLLVTPTYDRHGVCICGASLPPMQQWDDADRGWQNVTCGACGRGYGDEETFIAIYDDGLDDDEPEADAPPPYPADSGVAVLDLIATFSGIVEALIAVAAPAPESEATDA